MAAKADDRIIVNELLCFLGNKCKNVAFDTLVKISCDFFNWDEIVKARNLVMSDIGDGRVPKRKGDEKEKSTMSDLLKIVLDPAHKLPKYVALDLARIPPVGLEDVDGVSVCSELSAIRVQLKQLLEWKATFRNDGSAAEASSVLRVNMPSLDKQPSSSYAQAAAQSDSGAWQKVERKSEHKKQIMKCGTASGSSLRVATKAAKSLDIFVSRFAEDTTVDEVKDSVKLLVADMGALVVICDQLKTKHKGYASFHVTVEGPSENVKAAEEALFLPDSWTAGIIYRKFYVSRNHNRANHVLQREGNEQTINGSD
jgi:hypothetical protein